MSASGRPLLVAALSGRAIAEAAAAGGWRPIVLDGFADADTRAVAPVARALPIDQDGALEAEALLAAAAELAPVPIPLAWGAGLEGQPELLDRLAAGRELLGNDADLLRQVKDPLRWQALLHRLGLPHPETRLQPPDDPQGWLVKRAGASGGGHVRPASASDRWMPGHCFQRRVAGTPCSLQLLGHGGGATLLAVARQLTAPDGALRPWRFGGVVLPLPLPPASMAALAAAADAVAAATGLRGLASLDLMLDADGGWQLIELNPRPGASLDPLRHVLGADLLDRHVDGCHGIAWTAPALTSGAAAGAMIVYLAADGLIVPEAVRWPDWVGDRPIGGQRIAAGWPVCTVRAEGPDAAAVQRLLERRRSEILEMLER